jgi:transcriptional regulator with XRE-family HTH domain
MAEKPRYRPSFIRAWREHRHMSIDTLAGMIPMDKGNLSKIERGLKPYNQELLERLSEALNTEPASLLMRDPSAPDAIWSIWDRAQPAVRRQIEAIAETLVKTGTQG